jgi:DNA-binding SARP family transcriptional activator/tetratricopeptide (TPR) repeat protein
VEFRVLGPLDVAVDGRSLDVGGVRQQTVLACLLLDPNRTVSVGRLMEAIYGEDPPPTSRTQVQISISSLRRRFAGAGSLDIIVTQPQGYAIHVADGELDASRFDRLIHQARAARAGARLAEAVSSYRAALSLWRGPALDGIPSRLVQATVELLAERRITANEDCIELELDLGRHYEVVGELAHLVDEHPLRERLRAQLMIALYRSGRQAEALQVYRLARQTMIDELGIEPDERLQRLEQSILVSDPALNMPAGRAALVEVSPVGDLPATAEMPAVPRLLPTDMADFTGRDIEIDTIEWHLVHSAEDSSRLAVPIVVIVGMPGIGKSSMVVHASHRVAERFPDGQLFADLHGGSSRQVSPMQVLERFIRGLGVPGTAIPEGLDERAELYRALLADRRILVVLDDAAGESQVLPLLPGAAGCSVLITSRSRLAGLPGVKHVPVEVFDSRQSLSLLSQIAGAERVQSDPQAAETLAELCGHLPLALRIAGARLSARPHWSVEQLTQRLEDETRRLDELMHGNLGIRATISLIHESVGEKAKKLFRRLAILDTPLFSGWVGAALLDISLTESEDLLDELTDAQLIEATDVGGGVRGHYRFHDLIRLFAREQLALEESAAERRLALERVLGALLFLVEEAHRREYGGAFVLVRGDAPRWLLPARLTGRLLASPLDWYESERTTLVAGIHQAAQAGLADYCWDLAIGAVTLFESRMYLDDWRSTHQIALEATRQAQDVRGQAAMLYSIGSLYIIEQRFGEARRDLDEAVGLFQKADDEYGTALCIRNIAFLDRMAGRREEAAAHYAEALVSFRQAGDQVAEAYVLHNLAQLRIECADYDVAENLLAEALLLSRDAGSRRVEAQVLHRMGDLYLLSGRPDRTAEVLATGMACVREIGDPVGEAYTLHGLGVAQVRLGEFAEAESAMRRALQLATSVGDQLAGARILLGMAELELAREDPCKAISHCLEALARFRDIGATFFEARTLVMLSDAHTARGDAGAARAAAVEALALEALSDTETAEHLRTQLNDP